MRRLTKRERTIAAVTVVTFAVTGLYVYVLEPVWLTFQTQITVANQRESELAELQSLTERQAEIEAAYEQLRGSLAASDGDERPDTELQREITELVKTAQMTLSNIRPLDTVREREFDRYGAQFETRGEHHQFVRFLQSLQDKGALFYCDSIHLTARAGAEPITASFRVSRLARKER